MTQRIKALFPQFLGSILNSYSQVFFSNHRVFAILLVVVSFFDLYAGLAGALAVVISNAIAYLTGFNRYNIKSGFYGFNSLLVGLGLGIYYQPGWEFFLVLFFASLLTLFITIALEGVIGKYGLPFLSVPFLFGIWMVSLASRSFSSLMVSERGILLMNDMQLIGGQIFLQAYNWLSGLRLHESVVIYFRSMGAIFFQYHLFAGILVTVGLLIYSRIAFLLSLLGFFGAYLFYNIVGGNLYELSYSYIGFNFILTAIAVGGFFVIPSWRSFLWVILLIPAVSIVITSAMGWMGLFQLSVFSLPFNMIVLLFLYVLKFRERYLNKPEVVSYQHFSPEKNLYSHISSNTRFLGDKYLPFSLPFWGEWTVTQGHHGKFTHKEGWANAWDFEIEDEEGMVFKGNGNKPSDYYCYNKPVIATADGWVETVVDGIDDNRIGEVNLQQNWGNTLVIKHHATLFSKMSHLKKDSVKVKRGDFVRKGDILAFVGNSGRSPKPHLHFQFQETPYIGSKTLQYPFGHYLTYHTGKHELMSFSVPKEGEKVFNIQKNNMLAEAFRFVPGRELSFRVKDNLKNKETKVVWEIMADMYNNSYIYSKTSRAVAYFRNDDFIHLFTSYSGPKDSMLYYFYLSAYKCVMGSYPGLVVEDEYPPDFLYNRLVVALQDFIAPFYIFLHPRFRMEYPDGNGAFSGEHALLKSNAVAVTGKQEKERLNFSLLIESNIIKEINIRGRGVSLDFIADS